MSTRPIAPKFSAAGTNCSAPCARSRFAFRKGPGSLAEGTPRPQVEAAHHRVGRNIVSNWTGFGVNLLVSFLISPFLVHNLGDIGYGIWAVSLQLCGSLSLLDIGLRTAVTRYLTHH